MSMNATRNQRRTIEGTVVSDKMQKTITVLVERTYRHPKYEKFVRKQKRYHSHDEKGEARIGDRVEIRACRPLSRLKRWTLVRVVERATIVDAVEAGGATAAGDRGGRA